jgi:hypothetical protein
MADGAIGEVVWSGQYQCGRSGRYSGSHPDAYPNSHTNTNTDSNAYSHSHRWEGNGVHSPSKSAERWSDR